MTDVASPVTSAARQRRRTARWVAAAFVAVVAVAVLTTTLTAARPGGRMEPDATSPEGAHALVALLRDRGVEVVVADRVDDVERAARPDSLVITVQTGHLTDESILHRLAAVPGDRLVVEPISRTREILAPEVRRVTSGTMGGSPDCDLREAIRAGDVQLGSSDEFEAAGGVPVTRCYDGALVRYTHDGRTVTVVGSADFMVNSGLTKQGNAALAMNLAGAAPRVIWYAPQRSEGESSGDATITDLIPDHAIWVVVQLCLVVVLLALWKGRRIGPLVAEQLPVVVRASETVEGRGRLYRSHRAGDRAADALRTASLQRISPRLGLEPHADHAVIVATIAQRIGWDPQAVGHVLYGPPPATDTDLVNLANALDDIERQVAQS